MARSMFSLLERLQMYPGGIGRLADDTGIAPSEIYRFASARSTVRVSPRRLASIARAIRDNAGGEIDELAVLGDADALLEAWLLERQRSLQHMMVLCEKALNELRARAGA